MSDLEAEETKASFFVIGGGNLDAQAGAGIVKINTASLNRMIADGDLIANHSFSHLYLYNKVGVTLADFAKNVTTFQAILGNAIPTTFTAYARLPGSSTWRVKGLKGPADAVTKGILTTTIADSLASTGYQIFGWDAEWQFDTRQFLDADETEKNLFYTRNLIQTPAQMEQTIMKDLKNGKTVKPNELMLLSHDRSSASDTNTAHSLAALIKLLKADGVAFDTVDHY